MRSQQRRAMAIARDSVTAPGVYALICSVDRVTPPLDAACSARGSMAAAPRDASERHPLAEPTAT